MDSDTVYRMIISFSLFVVTVVSVAILWPIKPPQKHYESPLLKVVPRKVEEPIDETPTALQEEPAIVDTPNIEIVVEDEEEQWPEKNELCLLCKWGGEEYNHGEDGKNGRVIAKLLEIITQYHGKISNRELAEMAYAYYTTKIVKDKKVYIEQEKHTFLDHFDGHHAFKGRAFIVESIRQYQQIIAMAKSSMYLPIGSIDPKAFKLYQNASNKLQELYMMPVDRAK